MKKKSVVFMSAMTIAGAFLNGCGSSSSGGGTSLLSTIPTATGPVVSSRAMDLVPIQLAESFNPLKSKQSHFDTNLDNRTFSMKAVDWATNSWSGKSGPLCNMGQQVAQIFRDASQADKILCYVTAMDAAGLFTDNNFDGNWKYYQVTGTPDRGSLKVKFRVQTEGGVVKDFKMFTADSARPTGRRTCANSEFIHANLASSPASVTTVFNGSHTDGSFSGNFKGRTVASGEINSNGEWLSKTITSNNAGTWTSTGYGSTNAMYSVLEQAPDFMTLSGSMAWTQDNNNDGIPENSSNNRLYSKIDLVDSEPYQDLTFGAGSVTMISNWPGESGWSHSRGWDATGNVVPFMSSVHEGAVTGATVPSLQSYGVVVTAATLDSAGDECWDGNAPSDFTSVVFEGNAAAAAGIQACNEKFGENSGNNWVQCYSSANFDNSRTSIIH